MLPLLLESTQIINDYYWPGKHDAVLFSCHTNPITGGKFARWASHILATVSDAAGNTSFIITLQINTDGG